MALPLECVVEGQTLPLGLASYKLLAMTWSQSTEGSSFDAPAGVTTLEDLRTAAATAAAGTNTEASAHAARGKAANTGAKGPVAVLPDHVIASVADLLPQP